jgi:hypothetical protein
VDIASGRLKAATSEYTNRVLQQQWLAILGSIAWDRGDTMEHSDELRDLTKRLYEAEATGDLAFIERHFSRQEGAVYIGSDPNEWWEGFEAFVDAMRAQSDAIGGCNSEQRLCFVRHLSSPMQLLPSGPCLLLLAETRLCGGCYLEGGRA